MSKVIYEGVVEGEIDGGVIQTNFFGLTVGFEMPECGDVGPNCIDVFDFGGFFNVGFYKLNQVRNSAGGFLEYFLIDLVSDKIRGRGDSIKMKASEDGFDFSVDFIKPEMELTVLRKLF